MNRKHLDSSMVRTTGVKSGAHAKTLIPNIACVPATSLWNIPRFNYVLAMPSNLVFIVN